jgi:hypothetical protein
MKVDLNKPFNQFLDETMKERNHRMFDVQQETGICNVVLNNFLDNTILKPQFKTFVKLSKYLGIDVYDCITWHRKYAPTKRLQLGSYRDKSVVKQVRNQIKDTEFEYRKTKMVGELTGLIKGLKVSLSDIEQELESRNQLKKEQTAKRKKRMAELNGIVYELAKLTGQPVEEIIPLFLDED